MRDPRAEHASGKQAALVGSHTRLPYYLGDLLVEFRVDEPGIMLGDIRDSGGPPVSGNVGADLIGCWIELRIAPRDPQLAQV
jgi:hypothetical protein